MNKLIILIITFLAFFLADAQSGTIYYENGKIKKISINEKDSAIVKLIEYYSNGQLKSQINRNKVGQRVGKSVRYYKNGEIAYIWNHNQEGKKDGQWIGYNEDGSINSIENYTNGIETGVWKGYWEGKLFFIKEYNQKGILIKDIFYRENGKKLNEYTYDSQGKIISKEYYDENGKKLNLRAIQIIKSSCN